MAYKSQAERKNLSIAVPLVEIDATGCIDASPGRPVLDVSSPKALGSPTKQSLHLQRKNNAAVFESSQRRRRSCHGTLAEQHSPGWQLKQSWTLDSKHAAVTACSSSLAASNITSAINITSKQDAAGSSSKQDQQAQSQGGSASGCAAAAVPAEHEQQHQEAAADADVTVQAARPPSPFAAPEVQACTCHMLCGKSGCKVHHAAAVHAAPSSKMVYTGTATTSSNGSTNSSSSNDTSTKEKVKQKLRKVANALWQGMSLTCWHPSATVPGMGGACMLRK
jgi:hypothetical protein